MNDPAQSYSWGWVEPGGTELFRTPAQPFPILATHGQGSVSPPCVPPQSFLERVNCLASSSRWPYLSLSTQSGKPALVPTWLFPRLSVPFWLTAHSCLSVTPLPPCPCLKHRHPLRKSKKWLWSSWPSFFCSFTVPVPLYSCITRVVTSVSAGFPWTEMAETVPFLRDIYVAEPG